MQGRYFEAAVTGIDAAKQTLTANFPKHAGLEQYDFQVPYDILIYSVGSVVNTFGIKVSTCYGFLHYNPDPVLCAAYHHTNASMLTDRLSHYALYSVHLASKLYI